MEKLQVDADINLEKLSSWLKRAEQMTKTSWKKMEGNLNVAPKVNTKKIKGAEKAIDKSTWKMKNSFVSLADASELQIEELKNAVVADAKEMETAFALSPEKNTEQIKRRADSIRKVWLTAKDTWKQLSKLEVEQFIQLWINKNKITNEINTIKQQLNTAFKRTEIDIDVQKAKVLKELNEISASKKRVTDKDTLIQINLRSEELKRKLKELENRKRNLSKRANIELNLKTDQLKRQLTDVNRQMRNMENVGKATTSRLWKHFNTINDSLRAWLFSTFGALSVWWALARGIRWTVDLMRNSISIAKRFESAFIWVRKTTEATASQFETLKGELKDLTTQIPLTFEEISKIAELGGQMWVPVEQIKEFTRAVAQIGSTTNLSIEDAATQFARLANVLWEPLDEIDKLASSVVDLGNNFAAQENEILNFTTRIAGAGNVVWLTGADLAGIATALTSVGIKAELWWTAVNKALLDINWAVQESWDALESFAKVAWTTAEDFAKQWEEDTAWAFNSFVQWLSVAWDNADSIISELLWNNVRTKQAFLNLASAWDLLTNAIERSNTAYKENIALSKEAELRYGSEESKLKILTNEYEAQQEVIGKNLLPAFVSLQKIKISLLRWFTRLSEAVWWAKNAFMWLWIAIAALWVIVAGLSVWFAPILTLVWVLWALWISLYKLWQNSDVTTTKMDRLRNSLWKISKELKENSDAQEDLISSYISWWVTIDEYRKKMEKLIEKESELNALREESQTEIEKINKSNELLARSQKEQEKLARKEIELQAKIQEEKEKIIEWEKEMMKQYKINEKVLWKNKATIIYNEQLRKSKESLNLLIQEKEKLNSRTEQTQKTIEQEAWLLQVLNYALDDSNEVTKAFNEFHIDKDASKEEIEELTKKYEDLAFAAKVALKAQLAEDKKTLTSLKERVDDAWPLFYTTGVWQDVIKDIKATNDSIRQTEALIKEIDEYEFTPIKNIDWLNSANKSLENFNSVMAQISNNADEINEQIEKIWLLLKDWNISDEQRQSLLKKQTQLQADLTELKEAETNAIKDWNSSSDVRNKILKAELALLETQYIQRINAINDIYDDDLERSKKLVEAKEEFEEEKRNLENETHKTIIENAEAVIKKYEELKKKWQKSFSDIAWNIEDVADDLADISEEIKEINKEMIEIDSEAVEDMKDRYTEVLKEIDKSDASIEDMKQKIDEANESTEDLEWKRKGVSSEVEDSQKKIDWYQDSINDINKSIEDVQKTSWQELAEAYVTLWDEIEKNQERLDELNEKTALSTKEEEEKLSIQEEITKSLEQQAKARAEISDEQIDRAELLAWETDVERIIREREETKAQYELEVQDLEDKLNAEQEILKSKKEEEASIRARLDEREKQEQQEKLNELKSQLEQYYDDRETLIKERAQLERALSDKEIQDAIDEELETKTTWIIKQRTLDLAAKQQELDDLKKSNKEKLDEMKKYYIELYKLNRLWQESFGESFNLDDFDFWEFEQNIWTAKTEWLNNDIIDALNEEKEAQKEATEKLWKLSDILDSFIRNSWWDKDNLTQFLKIATWLREQANLSPILDQKTLNTVNQSNVFQVSSGIDVNSLEAMLRRSVKI